MNENARGGGATFPCYSRLQPHNFRILFLFYYDLAYAPQSFVNLTWRGVITHWRICQFPLPHFEIALHNFSVTPGKGGCVCGGSHLFFLLFPLHLHTHFFLLMNVRLLFLGSLFSVFHRLQLIQCRLVGCTFSTFTHSWMWECSWFNICFFLFHRLKLMEQSRLVFMARKKFFIWFLYMIFICCASMCNAHNLLLATEWTFCSFIVALGLRFFFFHRNKWP